MTRSPYVGLHVATTGRRATAADIVASVVREIASGALPAGSRLPPVRALEKQLGLSKNTAQAAYDELVARGLVDAREREGMFVLAEKRAPAIAPIAHAIAPSFVPPALDAPDVPRGMIALSTVFVDPELLPIERIAECARAVLRERMPAQYDAQGYPPLRAAIAHRLQARGSALAYLIPSFHNPTGYSYTSAELRGVLDACARHGVAILEDDWGSDMLSDGEYRPMLRALGGDNVLYVNSFTKKLLPSLRIGFCAAPRALVPTLVAMKRLSMLGNAWLTEAIVGEFLARGYYDTHLHALQRALDARYAACLTALDELMPDGVRWTRPGGGPTLWLDLPRSIDLGALAAHVARRGVHVSNVAAAYVGAPHLNGFRIAYAYLAEDVMRRALTIVADAVRAM
jgi:DNA-binding transcriptional MocR family regulator